MNVQIKAAFNEVRKYCPDVTQCLVSVDGRWCFMDAEFNAPKFHLGLNTSILEDMVDSLDTLPAAFDISQIN